MRRLIGTSDLTFAIQNTAIDSLPMLGGATLTECIGSIANGAVGPVAGDTVTLMGVCQTIA